MVTPDPTNALANSAPRKPNLFLIGAMKSGTTYLTKLLAYHPSVFMCRPEEPSYFVDPGQLRKIWPYMWDQKYWKGEEHYLRLFQGAGNAIIIGESSTNYSKRPLIPDVPEKIRAFNATARFIYIMRDPIERTLSHYWHMVRYHGEYRPMLRAIAEEHEFCDVSYYAMQLKPFFECFGREQVKTLTFEELVANPNQVMKELFIWLNVDTSVDLPDTHVPENVTPDRVAMARARGVLQWLRQSGPIRSVTPYVPRPIRRTGVRLATRTVDRRTVDIKDAIMFLQPIQRRQTEELASLLGRSFPEWHTLYKDLPP